MWNFFKNLHEMDILKPIREAGEFTGPVEEKLKAAIVSFLEK